MGRMLSCVVAAALAACGGARAPAADAGDNTLGSSAAPSGPPGGAADSGVGASDAGPSATPNVDASGAMPPPDALQPEAGMGQPTSGCPAPPFGGGGWPMPGHDARGTRNAGVERDAAALRSVATVWHVGASVGAALDPIATDDWLLLPRLTPERTRLSPSPERWTVEWEILALEDGRPLCVLSTDPWEDSAAPQNLAAAIGGGLLHVPGMDASGARTLVAHGLGSGAVSWRAPFPVFATSAVVADGRVLGAGVAAGPLGLSQHTIAITAATGDVAWEAIGGVADVGGCMHDWASVSADPAWGGAFTHSLCLALTGTVHDSVEAHELSSGQPLWGHRDPVGAPGSFAMGELGEAENGLLLRPRKRPLLFQGADGRHLVGTVDALHDLVARDADTGEVAWESPVHVDGALRSGFSQRALAGDVVVVAANAAPLSDPGVASGATRCPGEGYGCTPSAPIGARLLGLRTGTGEPAWSLDLPALVSATLAASGSLVFVAVTDELWVVDARLGSVLARWALDEVLVPAPPEGHVVLGEPLVAGNRWVIRVGTAAVSALYALALPP